MIKAYITHNEFLFSGVGKSDYLYVGPSHPVGLITRKSVVQIYSPLLLFLKLGAPLDFFAKLNFFVNSVKSLLRFCEMSVCRNWWNVHFFWNFSWHGNCYFMTWLFTTFTALKALILSLWFHPLITFLTKWIFLHRMLF